MSDDLMNREFLIFKRGRGWYRPESQGYTAFKFEAGRYTQQEAEKITHPNGLDGPRDGMFYKHENEVSDIPSARIEELEAENAELKDKLEKWVIAEYDNGDVICLSGFAGGASEGGAWSTLTLMKEKANGEISFREYKAVKDWETTLAELTGGKGE